MIVIFNFDRIKPGVDIPGIVRCVAARSGNWPSLAMTPESQKLRSPVTFWWQIANERPAWHHIGQWEASSVFQHRVYIIRHCRGWPWLITGGTQTQTLSLAHWANTIKGICVIFFIFIFRKQCIEINRLTKSCYKNTLKKPGEHM